MNFFYYFFCSDNDKPSLSASSNSPVEGGSPVTLTCTASVSSGESVSTFEWYKSGSSTKISGQSSSTYDIGSQRSADGSYTCKVVAANSGTSVDSDSETIAYYCEYFFTFQGSRVCLELFYKLSPSIFILINLKIVNFRQRDFL